jgi:rubrerythrin
MLETLTLRGCIEFAVATEEHGAETYARLAEKFSRDPETSKIFSRLSEDERIHKQQFSNLLGQALKESAAPPREDAEYLQAMSYITFFSKYKGPFKDIDSVKDRDDALVVALEFEKATLGFYRAVEEVEGGSEVLKTVIDAEKSHIVAIMKALLVEGSKFRGLQDDWGS